MKINEMIREKRKELCLTQQQVADYLGVSTPAVNKWEKGSTYPDITILPALARLLKTDLNTLLSFTDDLTDIEVENFVNELDQIVQQQGYDVAFQLALDKIHAYPTCEMLLYLATAYLDGALVLYNVSERERYQTVLEDFYVRLSTSKRPEIRDVAMSMRIAYLRNRGDFSQAEELINSLSAPQIDKEQQLAVLYTHQKKYLDAEKLWEHRILKATTEIQGALGNMLEIALEQQRNSDAEQFADAYMSLSQTFDLPAWMSHQAHLLIAIHKQDSARCLSILSKMLPAMKAEWNPQDSRFFRHASGSSATALSSKLLHSIQHDLLHDKEYAFIREDPQFDELIAALADEIEPQP